MLACRECLGLNKLYVPLAINLALETGMRLQEIFNLEYTDIDINERTITIRKSKTDYLQDHPGRTIVLPFHALVLVALLATAMKAHNFRPKTLRIFPMSSRAFAQSWSDVLKRAEPPITDLHFHDLRREAGSKFEEAGLTGGERDLMLGHANKDMRSLYSRGTLKSIRDKLDRVAFGGDTFEEAKQKIRAQPGFKEETLTPAEALKYIGKEIREQMVKRGLPIMEGSSVIAELKKMGA
jgi:integrase